MKFSYFQHNILIQNAIYTEGSNLINNNIVYLSVMILFKKTYKLALLLIIVMIALVSCQKGGEPTPQFDEVNYSTDEVISPTFREGDFEGGDEDEDEDDDGDGSEGGGNVVGGDDGEDDDGGTVVGGDDGEDDDGGPSKGGKNGGGIQGDDGEDDDGSSGTKA